MQGLTFKVATTESELQAVHRLNYRTFVEEIPQYLPNSSHSLIDRFNRENTYLVAMKDQHLIGMVAIRDKRPFSLDQKLTELDSYLPDYKKICEIRLLSVEPGYRNGAVFKGLMSGLVKHVDKEGYDLAVISGTTRQLKLYRKMGFTPFGPLIGKAGAMYQPMYMSKATFKNRMCGIWAGENNRVTGDLPLNFLPGPVNIKSEVQNAFSEQPISHRSEGFKATLKKVKTRLTELTGARHVEVMLGSGTLANDAIAWQLKQLNEPGLILTTGEFGDRLVDHAQRADLDIEVVSKASVDLASLGCLRRALERSPRIGWLWTVHCETSTGALYDIETLKALCRQKEVKLCLDAISTFGVVPLDLRDVYFASAVSGKAVGGYPGLAMVFYSHMLEEMRFGVPRYIDLRSYADCGGVPYTHSSNLVEALDTALSYFPAAGNTNKLQSRAAWLRNELNNMGCEIVKADEKTSPAVITIDLPEDINSQQFGDKMASCGCLLSYQSDYLLTQNRVQICLMSNNQRRSLQRLIGFMRGYMQEARNTVRDTSHQSCLQSVNKSLH